MDQELLETILKKHEQENAVQRILWIKSEPAAPDGENYLSTVIRITAAVVLGSGVERTINVVVKSALENGAASEWTMNSGVFAGEIKVYRNILSKMTELMFEFNDKRGKLWPALLADEPKKLIFEDLKASDFYVANRSDCLDLTHAKLVVRSLARIHAMSKILLNRKIISPADVQPYALFVNVTFTNKLFGKGLEILAREMKCWGPEWNEIREKVLKASYTISEKLIALNKADEGNFNVINHGDSWICNLMFKYDPYENVPIELRFVDYQLSHYQSYGWDLTYFLYTSLLGETRRKHYNELVSDYAKSLRESLLMYDYPENEIPTLDDVHKDMKRLQLFSLPICLLTHPIMTMPVEKSYCLSEGLKPEVSENCGYNLDIFRGRYKAELGPDLRKFAEIGII